MTLAWRAATRCLFCLLVALLVRPCAAAELRLGTLAWQGSEEAEVQWAYLVRQLEHRLPGTTVRLSHYDLQGMAAALKAGEVDFVVTNPGHYVTLEEASGVTRLATQVADTFGDPAHVVGSTVVVRDERKDLRTLEDLRGGTLAAVSPEAFGGYQLVWSELRHRHLDPERGNPRPRFTGFPMSRVVDAVLRGEADAGVLRACLLERLEREGALQAHRLRVLSPRPATDACRVTSQLYPGWAFAAASQTAPALSRDVLMALLSIPPDADGQSWTVPADYRRVHALLRELQIGPYAFLRETGWNSMLRRYWPWAAGLGLLLAAGMLYTLRVEHLVQRRTRELTAALAERRRLEERVQAGQQQMDHLSRLSILGELAGTLAHELNQPLAAIGNYARSLQRRQARNQLSAEALTHATEEIAGESERAAGILAGIRAFARKRPRVREETDLGELVHEAVFLIRGMLAQAPGVTVIDELAPEARQLRVDPLQIQQVLLNLLKNACDAQQAAQVDRPVEVRLRVEGDYCVVAVRDHGNGLAPELRGRLFEPFFTTKSDGLGLGLPICKTIVEAHGGELLAEPAPSGHGMVFRFTLPRPANARNPTTSSSAPLP